MKEAQARNIYLKDYQVPDFFIDETHLNVSLYEEETFVEARLKIRRNPASGNQHAALVLNGKQLQLLELALDGKALENNQYSQDAESLRIEEVPDVFELTSRKIPVSKVCTNPVTSFAPSVRQKAFGK